MTRYTISTHAMRRWCQRFPGRDIHRAVRKAKRAGPECRKRVYAGEDTPRDVYVNRKAGALFVASGRHVVTVLPYHEELADA